ncbi:hypothetical protein N781_09605 [Pontibacillus halophilus JSM 076056 = DSM 19796]|uniref:DUF4274 domain-containing protein n=1 Tax=Pontibacillus halophilus JSM 076056 = DSM 19796 TaxID=1385510 RepID=A0A0A5G9P0_9BACI|nr:DUF4274 domain-containing protein [Pontibacillus halophilus]KGX88764.1 hypothetical protein N781_09605 [Pontibacillus halophilus JSM 076056 = DSM 19796]
MDEKDIMLLKELLYHTNKDIVVKQLMNIDNPLFLHFFSANYNWNNGFEVPTVILHKEICDLGTGLLMFHYADGFRLLEGIDEDSSSTSEDWEVFLRKTYYKLLNLDFKSQDISFDPGLTQIQKYKLKKNNPNLPDVLISESPGEKIDMPKI